MTDWDAEIAKMAAAKQLLHDNDSEDLWRHEPPRPPATEEQLNAATQKIGRQLDTEYASFLRHANGWPAFLQDIDLFGTTELLGPQLDDARELLSTIEPEVRTASNINPETLLPIGASATEIGMFVIPRDSRDGSAPVIWLAGLEVERYDTFVDFFREMIAQNLEEARDIQQ